MNSRTIVLALAITFPIASCDEKPTDGPPTIRLAHDLCAECNMIISDARWSTATIVEGPRGSEPRLFDDFSCQVRYEHTHPELASIARWSHDHASLQWIRTESAVFLAADSIVSPMGSGIAAFADHSDVGLLVDDPSAQTLTFAEAWESLRPQ